MTVKIGGIERPVKFTNNALIELSDEHGVNILNNFDVSSPKTIRAVCFVGLKFGARSEKKEIDFTIDDVGDWLDMEELSVDGAMGKIFSALKKNTSTDQKGTASGESHGVNLEK